MLLKTKVKRILRKKIIQQKQIQAIVVRQEHVLVSALVMTLSDCKKGLVELIEINMISKAIVIKTSIWPCKVALLEMKTMPV